MDTHREEIWYPVAFSPSGCPVLWVDMKASQSWNRCTAWAAGKDDGELGRDASRRGYNV